jgi:uncharacterized C2H2 Zn-finger protein
MGLFDRFKEVDNFVTKPSDDLFKCNICDMLSKDRQAMRKHVTGFHNEYIVYKHKYKKIPEIATATWINVYYVLTYPIAKDLSDTQINQFIGLMMKSISNIITSITKVVVGERVVGYFNPTIGKSSVLFNDQTKKGMVEYSFHRIPTIKYVKSQKDTKQMVEFLIRFREGGREGQMLDNYTVHNLPVYKNEKLTYGYSPLDFISDAGLFIELNKALIYYFKIQGNSKPIFAISFNENDEPCVLQQLSNILFMKNRVIDRINLMKTAPEIDEAVFKMKIKDVIEFEENYVKKNKGKDTEMVKEWLNAVDKLIKVKA